MLESLTLYHKILNFERPWERSLLTTLWEKEKMLVTSIFSMFSILPKTYISFCVTFILSSATALNFNLSKILSYGAELYDFYLVCFFISLDASSFSITFFSSFFCGCGLFSLFAFLSFLSFLPPPPAKSSPVSSLYWDFRLSRVWTSFSISSWRDNEYNFINPFPINNF